MWVILFEAVFHKMLDEKSLKVQETLESKGYKNKVIEIPESTHTAREAADALGCKIGQIAKSIVFVKKDQDPIIVVVSGKNKVDKHVLGDHIGSDVDIAKPDFVEEVTGFVVGGVPPVGHQKKIAIYIDEDLLGFAELWAAAGTSNSVFKLSPEELVDMTKGEVVTVR